MIPGTGLIPIRDENPTHGKPVVTITLIALNVLAFLVLQPQFGSTRDCLRSDIACQIDNCEVSQFFFKWGIVPVEVVQGEQLTGEICTGVQTEQKSVMLSLLTSMFLHGGFLHLAGNMLFLWVFGNNIEDRLKPVKFVIFYLVTGVIASLAHVFFNASSQVPTIGASGAVAGILGGYILLFPRAMVHTLVGFILFFRVRLPAITVLGLWFVSQFFIGGGQQVGEGGVAWVAHVGGFLAGMALIHLMGGGRARPSPAQPVYPAGPFGVL